MKYNDANDLRWIPETIIFLLKEIIFSAFVPKQALPPHLILLYNQFLDENNKQRDWKINAPCNPFMMRA